MDDEKGTAAAPDSAAGPVGNSAPDGKSQATKRRTRRGFHRSRAPRRAGPRSVDLSKIVGMVGDLPIQGRDAADRKRRLLAELCKVVGAHLSGTDCLGEELKLPQRVRQTLRGLIKGDSEKQIAYKLGISQHTVHVYVKQLYRRLRVTSRGELMAKFMRGT